MDAAKLVQALAVAWGGMQLYPDPTAVPAFCQAVETIGEYAGGSILLTVTVDGFESGTGPVDVAHGSADRLVQALFAQRVASLTVTRPPTPEELARFFATLEEKGDDLELELPTRLHLGGITAIGIRCHELLEDREEEDEEDEEDEVDRHPDVQALFETDSVRQIAERTMAASSPEAAAAEFVAVYRDSFEWVHADDPAGLERVVQTFVDAFFRLDHHYRATVFEAIVELREETAFQVFLDQFSADELADLAGEIQDSALPLLVEYARVVSEMQGRDAGLVERVMGTDETADARSAVAGSVGSHLAAFLTVDSDRAGGIEAIAAEVAELTDPSRVGWVVLGDLFAIEGRDDRLRRLLRIWVAKLAGAIRQKAFGDAVEWLRVVAGTGLDPRLLDEAFGQAATDEILEILTGDEPEDRADRDELFDQLSRRAGKRVLEQLATEEDPGRRRMLIDIVTEIARVDIRSVLPGLADPRWYVVRNIAIALGKSGRKAAGEPLARLIHHDDHRVRIEALRALLPCLGPAAVDHLVTGLADEHVRVRAAATDLLDVLEDDVVIPALSSGLRDETRPVEVRVAVIAALGRRSDDTARGMLQQVADSRTRFSQSGRTLRSAAREALQSGRA